MEEGEKLNKEPILITPDVIEECLCEAFDFPEKDTPSHKKTQRPLK